MLEILDKFRDYTRDPYRKAKEWKNERNRIIIGCLPMYFPEEIIHASGALPITLFGDNEPITAADVHLMTNACHQIRSTFNSLLKGKYDFLDGVACIHICDQVRFFVSAWQMDRPFPFFHEMCRPFKLDQTNRLFLVSELKRLISALEGFTGSNVSYQNILNSIEVYNKSRVMMRKLYKLRQEQPGIITAPDMTQIITSSMLIPREEYNQLLAELLERIEGSRIPQDKRLRIVVVGNLCEIPDNGLLNLIESQGLVIIDDDFFTGGRYFSSDISTDGDPIESLADHYMNMVPCSTYNYPVNRTEWVHSYYANYVNEMVTKHRASGVLLLRTAYCDPFDLEYVLLKKELTEAGVPFLPLFVEQGGGASEVLKTRVNAFVESLQ